MTHSEVNAYADLHEIFTECRRVSDVFLFQVSV